ncbi:hypothetical protein FOVSG1_005776 [Fusarium oxysporum f. sp. vasinfectum]
MIAPQAQKVPSQVLARLRESFPFIWDRDERTKPPVISVVSYHSPSATFHVGHSGPYQWAARVERATRYHEKDTLRKSSNDPFLRTLHTHWILCGCSWILVSFFACLRQFNILS